MCYSQEYKYNYEMAFHELETGYYYVEYAQGKEMTSVHLQICVIDIYHNPVTRNVNILDYPDTLKYRTDEFGVLYYDIKQNHKTLCISIDNFGTRWPDFYKCIHFWGWNENRVPQKLVIVLGEKEPGVIHIESDKPLNADHFQEIKNKYLRKNYKQDSIENIQMKRLIYY